MLANTDLSMGGYSSDRIPAMQRRMLDALQAIPGVKSVGLVDRAPLSGDLRGGLAFKDETTDLSPTNAAADALVYSISPDYFHAAGTALLSGMTFTCHDDKDARSGAATHQELAAKSFG